MLKSIKYNKKKSLLKKHIFSAKKIHTQGSANSGPQNNFELKAYFLKTIKMKLCGKNLQLDSTIK